MTMNGDPIGCCRLAKTCSSTQQIDASDRAFVPLRPSGWALPLNVPCRIRLVAKLEGTASPSSEWPAVRVATFETRPHLCPRYPPSA